MVQKYYGQFDVPVDQFTHERYFPGIRGGVFVECGAFDGLTECSCKFFEESMGWTGYNLEPVPHIFEKLKVNRPLSRNINIGLSVANGQLGFDVVVHPLYGRYTTIGSVAHSADIRAMLLREGCRFEHIDIEVVDWPTLVSREHITRIDLLVLDVEGHEMSVLAGMRGNPVLPEIMCVEFGHVGIDRLTQEMNGLGYIYDAVSYANAYYIRRDVAEKFAARRLAR